MNERRKHLSSNKCPESVKQAVGIKELSDFLQIKKPSKLKQR